MRLTVDIISREPFVECMDKIISGMLPHENYQPEMFSKIQQQVFYYIPLIEMKLEYRIIFSVLDQLRKAKNLTPGFIPFLSWDILTATLEPQLFDLVKQPFLGMQEFLISEGIADNLEIEGTLDTAASKLYTRVKDLYFRAYEMKITGSESLTLMPALKANFLYAITEYSMSKQRQILELGMSFGREHFLGPEGWLNFNSKLTTEVYSRVTQAESALYALNDASQGALILEEARMINELIAPYGIEILDQGASMQTNWLLVICANEGIGKTTLAVFMTALALSQGKKVCYMLGESTRGTIFPRILASYIRITRNIFITSYHVSGKSPTTEEMERVIKICTMEISEAGNLQFKDAFSYYKFYDEAVEVYEEYGSQIYVVDHTMALVEGKKMNEDITAFAVGAREFKKNYPVMVIVLSHLSSVAQQLVSRGKRIDKYPTKGSSALSGEADQVMVMNAPPTLKKRGLIALDVYKLRGHKPDDVILLRMQDEYCYFEYHLRDQIGVDGEDLDTEKLLESMSELYGEDGDEYGSFSSDDYDD